MIIGAIVLFVNAARMFFLLREKKESFGIPDGRIMYSDLNVPAVPLFSKRSRLIGKPDYIIRKEKHYVPVEIKSGRSLHPHESHMLQLAVYCQILEDIYGVFVPEGILVYNNVPHTIPFDPKLRYELESIMKKMRASLRNGSIQKNHQELVRCKSCSMKQYCNDAVRENS